MGALVTDPYTTPTSDKIYSSTSTVSVMVISLENSVLLGFYEQTKMKIKNIFCSFLKRKQKCCRYILLFAISFVYNIMKFIRMYLMHLTYLIRICPGKVNQIGRIEIKFAHVKISTRFVKFETINFSNKQSYTNGKNHKKRNNKGIGRY